MNTANKLTLFRILLIPVIVIVEYIDYFKTITVFSFLSLTNLLLLILFLIAIFTDFLDGYVARHFNMITDLGSFMDPLADKLLVFTLLLCLLRHDGYLGVWVVIILMAREFMVSGLRMVASSKHKVISADILGKIKANAQYIYIVLLLLIGEIKNETIYVIVLVSSIVVSLITVISGINYLIKNKEVFKTQTE